MTILLHSPDERQDSGFYRFLFDALRDRYGARRVSGRRPLPRMEQPRQHESVWIEWEGVHVLLDMSDHVFLFDVKALRKCDVYLKANLNRDVAEKVLERAGASEDQKKIRPFVFLPPTLASCARLEWITRPLRKQNGRPFDFCHIVGVYQNPFMAGIPPEAEQDIEADLGTTHFWVRYQIQRALLGAGLKGICRLTNRGDPALLDPRGVVRCNLPPPVFLASMLASRVTVLNTLPHAVFPWKALESVALGIPFVVERRPLISMPPEMELIPGRHYLELLPELPGFDASAEVEDPRAYRIFPEIRLARLRERAEWLKQEIRNRDRMDEMRFEVEAYRRRVLNPGFMARHVADAVAQAAGKGGGA